MGGMAEYLARSGEPPISAGTASGIVGPLNIDARFRVATLAVTVIKVAAVRYFLAVARTLNFTKAAEECNVTQPSLTRAIKKLEDELGGPLFHRERANTHLTDLGRAMLPHIEQSYLAAQSARALAEAFKRGDVAPLRLGLSNAVSCRLFTEVLNGVRSGAPNFELAVEGGSETQISFARSRQNCRLKSRIPWRGEFDPLEGFILHEVDAGRMMPPDDETSA